MIKSKSRLAIELSKLDVFENASYKDEQYPTDSEIAADVLWNAYFADDIEGKIIADLGAGTGILGIGALLLGAKKVFFIEKDESALTIAKKNYESVKEKESCSGEIEFIHDDIQNIQKNSINVDVVIQNPPFGTREKHADREFLEKAFTLAPIVYSFHKETSNDFLQKFSEDNKYQITHHWMFEFPIKASQLFHKRKIHRIKVGCWRFERRTLNDY